MVLGEGALLFLVASLLNSEGGTRALLKVPGLYAQVTSLMK